MNILDTLDAEIASLSAKVSRLQQARDLLTDAHTVAPEPTFTALAASTHRSSRLSADDISYIRRNPTSLSQQQLGERFGVSRATVSNVVRRVGGYA